MTGIQFFNDAGIETVNSNDSTMVVVASGNKGTIVSRLPWSAWPEPPTIFIRPTPGIWLGGFSMNKGADNTVIMGAQGYGLGQGFDWVACCSSSNPAAQKPTTNFGLETFDANGKLMFSSNQRFVRVKTIASVLGPYTSYTGTIISQSVPISGFTEMPWVNIRDACVSYPIDHGEYGSWPEAFLFTINASFSVLTVTLGDTYMNNYNQYYNKYMRFPLGFIDGN